MAKHPNIFKVKKQSRMRRAYLKGYDMGTQIKVQRRVGTADIPQEHAGYFEYRKRGNTYWDGVLDNGPGGKLMLTGPALEAHRKSRLECVNQLNTLTRETQPEMNVLVYKGGITKIRIRFYFSSDYSVCFFMKEDWRHMTMQKSGVYNSRDRAFWNLNNKKGYDPISGSVNWLETVYLPRIEGS